MELNLVELSMLEALEIKGGVALPLDTNNNCTQNGCTQSGCTDNSSCPSYSVCPVHSNKCWIDGIFCPITPEQGNCPGSGTSCPVQNGTCGD